MGISIKNFRRRNYIFAACTCFGTLINAVFLAIRGEKSEIQLQMLLTFILILSAISAGLWIHEYRKLKIAQLIVENPIISIRISIINNISNEAKQEDKAETTEVLISYFGILLETRMIKFNQGGILLKAVEIGKEFISLSYGTDNNLKKIWILRPPIDAVQLDSIAEMFRYETGIIPQIIP